MEKGVGFNLFLKVFFLFIFNNQLACNRNLKFDLPSSAESFVQQISYNNKVDILWILDNSSSMANHQRNLSAQVPLLVSKLNSLKLDYQMAVVTSSMGGINPNGGRFLGGEKILKPSTSNLVEELSARLLVGQDGSDNERGLESMEVVLSSEYQTNEGKGFLREDALLVVIALSDEDDKSKSSSSAISHYSQFLDGIKKTWIDGSRSWVFNFVGILSLQGACTTTSLDYKEPGIIFMGLADASNGTKSSLCSTDLSSAVSGIEARISQILTDFKLSSIPIESTLVVTINNKIIPNDLANGWAYIPEKNLIRFYGSSVPAADASIKVDFKPAEAN
jgi:hypothetical protein